MNIEELADTLGSKIAIHSDAKGGWRASLVGVEFVIGESRERAPLVGRGDTPVSAYLDLVQKVDAVAQTGRDVYIGTPFRGYDWRTSSDPLPKKITAAPWAAP